MPHFRFLLLAATLFLAASAAPAAEGVLTLATTTSTENSGLLAWLHPDFETQTGLRVKVIAKGTGASLQLARDGNADLVLAHAREQEDQFVREGFGALRRDVMYNDFVLLGPMDDPAAAGEAKTAVEAFRRVAGSGREFISRGDDSGTHVKEQEIWRASGLPLETKSVTAVVEGQKKTFKSVRPAGDWHLSIGQGMGKAILVTTEKRAYTLADRGTYYAFALTKPAKTDLTIAFEGDKALHNPYGVIAVNPEKHPHVNFAGAKRYIEWITSPAAQKRIGAFQIEGKALFTPSASAK